LAFSLLDNHMRLPIFPSTALACTLILCVGFLRAQDPAVRVTSPQQPVATAESSSAKSSGSKQSQTKSSHADDFLVRGTVFTAEGLALPGAELRIRRTSEKQFKWNDASNSRGEFAIRVKMGADYQVVVRAKGYQQQSQPVNATTGERFKDLVFRMQRQTGKKS